MIRFVVTASLFLICLGGSQVPVRFVLVRHAKLQFFDFVPHVVVKPSTSAFVMVCQLVALVAMVSSTGFHR